MKLFSTCRFNVLQCLALELRTISLLTPGRLEYNIRIQPVYLIISNASVKRKHFHLFFKLHASNEIIPITWLHRATTSVHRAKNLCRTDRSENKSIMSLTRKNYNEITHEISSCFHKNYWKSKFKLKIKKEKILSRKQNW